jgi:aminopeptidase N
MTVTVPEGMTAVSNGKLQGKTTAGERTRFVWKSSYPIAPYLVSVAAASYDVAYDTMLIDAPRPPGAGGTVRDPGAMQVVVGLYTYAYPADKERAREDFARTKLILRTLGGLFGPYPFAFDKYATVEVDGQLTMENQSAVSFQRNLITGDRRNESVLVHEIAHQWWGNLVGPASWDHLWLNEGTATYAEALFLEATSGAEAYARRIASLMERPDTFYLGSVVGQDDEDFWELFSPRTYDKAAIVLHMLRRQIGDEAFFMGVRSYFDDPALRYGTAVTEDFARHMERAAGVDLDWFFTQWMTTPAAGSDRPRLEYSWSWDGAGQVRVDVAQVQPGGFVYRLPLDIVAAGSGGAVTASVVDTLQTQSFVLAASARPDTVILDPDRKLFMDARPTAPKR